MAIGWRLTMAITAICWMREWRMTGGSGAHHLHMPGCMHLGVGEGTVCPGESSGSYQHAQSWSINFIHWIVPNYLIFLIHHFPFMKQRVV